MKSVRPRWEWPLVVGLLLLAFFMRVWQLIDVPPGLHHDEVIIGQVAKDILRGNFAIYFTAGYGHEPLYHYVVAGFFAALGASAFTLRLTSAFIAVLGLVVAYRLTRRLFSPAVALGTLAWMSIALWPVFFSRVGLRGITLPLLTTLTAYCLWRALHAPRIINYLSAGALLGLSIYTYQASRVFPMVFAVFFVYLAATRSTLVTRHSSLIRGASVFFVTALFVAAPLIIYLTAINPKAEERVADLSGPLNQLRAGDPSEVINSTLNTMGMFTIKGDAVPIYNVSERPVFPDPIGAALFYLGLLVCVWRWKQPAYAFMLFWFFISLTPAMVTPFSPNFVRTLAAWPVPFVLVGLGMEWVGQRVNWVLSKLVNWWNGRAVNRSIGQSVSQSSGQSIDQPKHHLVIPSSGHLVTAFFVLVLGLNALLTCRDYFLDWPRGDYVRFWQQATWTQAVRAISADPSTAPVIASGLRIQDFDPQTFDLLSVRSDLQVKWFDCRNAMVYPASGSARYLEPDFLPCEADLLARYLPQAPIALQPRWPDSSNVIFTLRTFDRAAAQLAWTARPVWLGGESFSVDQPQGDLAPLMLPVDFEGLAFEGWEADRVVVKAAEPLDLFTHWQLAKSSAFPLKIFIHVTAPDGKIVAQWDGLDVNVSTLDVRDELIQRHRLTLPADLPAGDYRVSLGVYHADSGQRLKAQLADRTVDSIVLGALTLVK